MSINADGINHKLKKYHHKITSSENRDKTKYYSDKINHYKNLIGGHHNLLQPTRALKFNPKVDFDSDPIVVNGFGQLRRQPIVGFPQVSGRKATAKLRNQPLKPVSFERRSPNPSDVVIEILYSGVCHSDWHSITGEWESRLPLVPGHEICGRVVRLGSSAKKFQLGDTVLVGTFVSSCRVCSMCLNGLEQYCENSASSTYDGFDRKPGEIVATGEPTHGGFSTAITVDESYVWMLHRSLKLESAAPLVCAGITVYSALKQMGIKLGQIVGIAGIGGLGHLAVKIAKAMGAKVIALTRTEWKLSDAKRIGADDSVLISDQESVEKYNDLLAFGGILWIIGLFDIVNIDNNKLAGSKLSVRSSITGGIEETIEMLDFCAKHRISPDVELMSIFDINKTYDRLINSDVKYRFVIDFNSK